MSKQVLDQVSEEAQKVEIAKQEAIELRHLVALEISSRPEKLNDQREEIARQQKELDVSAFLYLLLHNVIGFHSSLDCASNKTRRLHIVR